jgi:hypothetical protein
VGQLGKNFKATWLEKWGEEYNETMMHLRVFGGKGSRFPGLLNEAPEKKFSPPQRIFFEDVLRKHFGKNRLYKKICLISFQYSF